MPEIRNNADRHRLELDVEGHVALVEYNLADGVISFLHTEVPKELGGRGIGSTLARGALDWARAQQLKVVAKCPFIKGYIDKHAEYAGLLA